MRASPRPMVSHAGRRSGLRENGRHESDAVWPLGTSTSTWRRTHRRASASTSCTLRSSACPSTRMASARSILVSGDALTNSTSNTAVYLAETGAGGRTILSVAHAGKTTWSGRAHATAAAAAASITAADDEGALRRSP
ncbi:hypothetical protein TW95_gp1652 [Pandoravirus inopinatum]|uniref:Uncharacterized protein n=1 Tax=Pandoravirus inopinatum TaxID=1605721 RepID=A0A0B5JBI9_9VIRU|nr:hypothetical protein TW95_gp1652 [Pandoravirus inopinatum]AJF98386.1 hypothetical protein [Pandoravirus inopinatum]